MDATLPESMERLIAQIEAQLHDRPRLARMFRLCFANTWQTTVRRLPDQTTFVATSLQACNGGIGTSPRVVPEEAGGFSAGELVMSNFGRREHLVIDGVPVGRELRDWELPTSAVNPDLLG